MLKNCGWGWWSEQAAMCWWASGYLVGGLKDFSDSPEAKFPFPFFDLTGTGTGTWPGSCQLKGLWSAESPWFLHSQSIFSILFRNLTTVFLMFTAVQWWHLYIYIHIVIYKLSSHFHCWCSQYLKISTHFQIAYTAEIKILKFHITLFCKWITAIGNQLFANC